MAFYPTEVTTLMPSFPSCARCPPPALGVATLAVLFHAVTAIGCDSSRAPTLPTPGTTAPPVTYTISGIVTTATPDGPMPLSGVLVEETRTDRRDRTGADGSYRIFGVSAGSAVLRATFVGFDTYVTQFNISGDERRDIQIISQGIYTLSGRVFEMTASGPVPIEGVSLYCDSCGSPVGHTFVSTDAEGAYRFLWSRNGVHPLIIEKAGFDVPAAIAVRRGNLTFVNAIVNGDTRFDLELVRR